MSKMRKNRYVFIVVLLLMICLFIMLGFLIIRRRGGTVVYANEDVISNEEIIFYRQDDERWAKETLGDSKYTMGKSGCLVSCIASAVTMMNEEKTPLTLNEEFSVQNVFDAEGNILWDNLRNMGRYEVEVYQDVTSELLTTCLETGRYPIVRVRMYGLGNFHYVLIVKAENGEFYCMDPLKNGLTPLSKYGNCVYAVRCVYPV